MFAFLFNIFALAALLIYLYRIRAQVSGLVRFMLQLSTFLMEILFWIILGLVCVATVFLCVLFKIHDWVYALFKFLSELFIFIMELLIGFMNLFVIILIYKLYGIYYGW
ncbi:hypothetical protein F53441_1282 [Fusarium austroafricanum]|uniref:Uncharacterized protein n=1 Tax=Fusarium austroafricanum TaxID=2364996 RepID=A0A8H4KVW6_9HYPO|nr:hypothetical protein F53441_1282 [Fusarium austroafricanum]